MDKQTQGFAAPVPFTPSLEKPEPDEAKSIATLKETMLGISRKVHVDTGHPHRAVHAKSFALLQGELIVSADLPPELRQGLFAQAGSHPVTLRFSTPPGDLLSDKVSLPRALAIKVHEVEGERLPGLPGAEDGHTQDFILVNGPTFKDKDIKGFLRGVQQLAATTDKAPKAKEMLSAVARGAEKVLETVGLQSASLVGLGGHPITNPLGETFFTQLPLRFGDYVAKLSVKPVAPALTALTDQPLPDPEHDDALRNAANRYFGVHVGEWVVRAQLLRDVETMPIEDGATEWQEADSPWQVIARLTVPVQPAWEGTATNFKEDRLAFSVWRGLAAHQPLGSLNRARKSIYEASAAYRLSHLPNEDRDLPAAAPSSAASPIRPS